MAASDVEMKRFPSKPNSLLQLKRSGLRVATVLDVGIRKDTPELRQAFPEAKHVLFEPIVEHAEDIRRNYQGIDFILEEIALSDHDGTLELSIFHRGGTGEITHALAMNTTKGAELRSVRASTLDSYLGAKPQVAPYLVKLDVDGHETPILHGAVKTLQQASCLIVEATMPKLPERVAFATGKGFRLWDIVDFVYRDGALWQVDVVFVAEREIAANPRLTPWIRETPGKPPVWFNISSEFGKIVRSWET